MIKNVERTFVVGEKWLYYKLYCGVNTADTLLLKVIKPLTEELVAQKLIDIWFFIRYSDPDPHLRFRVKLIDTNNLGEVILKVKNLLKPYINRKQIWDIQLATYQRETNRYGINTIEEAETFFYHDSEMVLTIIKNSKDDEARFLNLFKWLEMIISLFSFDDKDLLSFLDRMQAQFKKEFRANKTIRKELSNKYRKLETQLFNEGDLNFLAKNNLIEILERFLILEKQQKLKISLNNLLASFIHMSINRCFRSKQRLYEMMLYDFLYRKNNSKFVRYGKL